MSDVEKRKLTQGGIFCLLSGAGFGTLLIFGKLSYQLGFSLSASLAWRFLGASVLLWFWLLISRTPGISRRSQRHALLLGLIGYAGQSAFFFGAMGRIGVALTSMLLYTYPSMVTLIQAVIQRRRPSAARSLALFLSLVGSMLTIHVSEANFDALGILLGLAAPLWYASYLTFGAVLVRSISPLVASTYICSGAALAFLTSSLLQGSFLIPTSISAWGVILGLVLVATVMPIVLLFEGIKRIGAPKASILSSMELVVTVALGVILFHETLSPVQMVGGVLVLAAVVVVQLVPDNR
jgi:drug/metabolite transporter (DMT)-like permease